IKRAYTAITDPAEHGNPQSRLRVALYAVAGIPEEDDQLKKELRNAIRNFRQKYHFKPPAASQIWALAVNPTIPQQMAVGDNNGVVWLWNATSSTVERGRSFNGDRNLGHEALTASSDIVNGLAFNSLGTLLAAAYRSNGVVVWQAGSERPY